MNDKFGNALRTYRKISNMTQEELASVVGVDRKTVSRWECGVIPRSSYLQALAEALHCTTETLLAGTPYEWVDRVLARLEHELVTAETHLEGNLPDDLRAYAIGKKEALTTAIKMIETEREVDA